MMRISTQQVFLHNIDNLSKASSDVFNTQQQLSTGKRVLQPSDDPLASAQIQKFNKEIARTEQFTSNIDVSRRRLELEENTINQVNNLSIRLRELTIQGKNGVLSDGDRRAVASEVGEIVKSLDGLMNTKDVQGEYLFSGNKGFTKPYTLDATTGRYEFNGDDGQRFIQVGPENKVASTDSGFDIFEKIGKVSGYVIPQLEQPGNQISTVSVEDADVFDAFSLSRGALNISFDVDNMEYTITDSAIPPQTIASAVSFAEGDVIDVAEAGVQLTIGKMSGDATAILDASSQHNILNTAMDLENELLNSDFSTTEGKADFNEKMDLILENLLNIEEQNIGSRASIGGRINTLDQQQLVNEDYALFTKEALSSFEDLDFNEAISRFQLQETILQASYASFAKVQDLSLFNYI
jgi:flagellar hook-associated protein 3 FlgL